MSLGGERRRISVTATVRIVGSLSIYQVEVASAAGGFTFLVTLGVLHLEVASVRHTTHLRIYFMISTQAVAEIPLHFDSLCLCVCGTDHELYALCL
jgi:hypothetical protein